MQTLAQDLAAFGRNGDSMMVHMNPSEVAGLQALAQSQGTSLTVNPETGMPEAFNLGDFFLNLLPTVVGAALAPSTGGASLGLTGGLATAAPIVGGALTGAALAGMKGEDPLLGGLTGGLGGYGGSGIAKGLASFGAPPATPQALAPLNAAMNIKGPGIQGLTVGAGGYDALNPAINLASTTGPNFAPATATTGMSPFSAGVSKAIQNPSAYMESIGGPMGVAKEYGMPLGGAALAALEPSDLGYTSLNDAMKDKDKYDPYATLNLSGDTGLRLLARGGEVKGYAAGGQLPAYYDMGGNFNTFERQDTPSPMPQLSQDGYGLGRLNQLAQQQSASRAASDVFAKGGKVEKESSLNLNTGKQSSEGDEESYEYSLPPLALASLGRSIPNNFSMPPMALAAMMREIPSNYSLPALARAANPFLDRLMSSETPSGTPITSLNLNSGEQETRYVARGGYLDGAGDGMSDSIPATIGGKQPARLADGEFVIPADVVSHLGNGSSKAGAKRLYAMMDKVRHARTGTKKQGKEINPNKYMPV